MAKDYNSYSFRNKAVDNIQSRSNTANDPEDKKKKKKKTTYTTNDDGSVTKTRTKRSGDIVKKTVKKPTRTTTPSEPKVNYIRNSAQRKKETAIQKKADQMVEDKGLITAPTPKEKRKIERTKRQANREHTNQKVAEVIRQVPNAHQLKGKKVVPGAIPIKSQ